jgi:hypothetical protein
MSKAQGSSVNAFGHRTLDLEHSAFSLRIGFVFAAAVLALAAATACAQDYRFGVPGLQMQVFVKPDASVHIVYDITFKNAPGAHPIDVVDIGTPHKGYQLSNVRASIRGLPLRDIRKSQYVNPGFEVHLGPGTIGPGQAGTLHVEFDMPEMVYQDTTKAELASLRITPTWFLDKFVQGNTHIQVAIHLPKSVKPDEVLHQGLKFSRKVLTKDGTSVVWDWPADRLTGPHMVAVSFPKRDLDRVVKKTKLDLLLEWFGNSAQARIAAGIVFLMLFGILFFRFSGGTGVSVFVILSAGAVVLFILSPGGHLLSLPTVVVLIGVNEWYLSRRKVRYMPPIAQVEGGGIKRGLTAPEAAALLELPVAKVLSLVIFGMLKKGLVHQIQADPLAVEADPQFCIKDGAHPAAEQERDRFYRRAGQQKGIVVHKYEHAFLFLLEHNPAKPLKDIDFGVPMRGLLEGVAARMKGFDLSDTQAYYRQVVRRACQQAKSLGDIPQREKAIDRNFQWILMDDDYPTVFTYGRPYWPVWTRGTTMGAPSIPSAAPSVPGQTSFGDVAASFTGWAENTMGSVASAISPGSLAVAKPSGGFLDLSGADRVTGDFFKALGEAAASGGSGGGGGCACAGCACACACAGGGR